MEPQVKARYDNYLADYLRSGFSVRQIANTYNVIANGLDQTLTLLILIVGATYVMSGTAFTIGMLVAFQMFASRVSQPMLRLVGLWQQFQQASLSVARLGDIMNAPHGTLFVDPRPRPSGIGIDRNRGLKLPICREPAAAAQGLEPHDRPRAGGGLHGTLGLWQEHISQTTPGSLQT